MSNNLMGNMLTEHTMEKAIKDKIIQQQHAQQLQERKQEVKDDFDPDFDDDDMKVIMNKMKEERLSQIAENQQKQKQLEFGIGEYREIVEEEFLPSVTRNKYVLVHFYHNDFIRCKIFDDHLRKIAILHTECKFYNLNAEKSPFFVQKLAIQMLPTLCLFIDGILKDRVIGFGDLGNTDVFPTLLLVRRLVRAKIIKPQTTEERGFQLKQNQDDSDEDDMNHDN